MPDFFLKKKQKECMEMRWAYVQQLLLMAFFVNFNIMQEEAHVV
jgi:hypothetical protein